MQRLTHANLMAKSITEMVRSKCAHFAAALAIRLTSPRPPFFSPNPFSSFFSFPTDFRLCNTVQRLFSKTPRLKTLLLYENSIKRIQDLQRCSKLTQLYLQHNCIAKIENLSTLTQLTKL